MYWKELNVFFFTFGSVSHCMSAPQQRTFLRCLVENKRGRTL